MNKRVLKTTIYLCWAFLIAFAILKIWFADEFAIAITNQHILSAGEFIDARPWLQQIIFGVTTFLTHHFYLCACCMKWHLSLKQYIAVALITAVSNIAKYYVNNDEFTLIINVTIMVLLPYLYKADYGAFVTILLAHYIGQLLITVIRGEALNELTYNTINITIMMADAYVWLLLYYLYSNLYKERLIMGNAMPPLWGKMNKQIEEQIKKLDEKIANTTDEKKLKKLNKEREILAGMIQE